MRKVSVVLLVVIFSLVFAYPQGKSASAPGHAAGNGKDDHDDSGPVQSGYAVVTVSGTSSSNGLVVFESYGLRKGNSDTAQAGVLPPDLMTNAILFVDNQGSLSKNLAIAIVNPNTTDANVTLTLRNSDGTTLGSTSVKITSHQQISKFVTDMFSDQKSVPKDVTGTVLIQSATPVSVVGLRFRGANFSSIPVTNLSTPAPVPTIATGVGGAGSVLLPQFASGGGWATEIVIANTGASNMTVRVDLFKPDGTALSASLNNETASSFKNIVIKPGGVFTLAPRNGDGDDDF